MTFGEKYELQESLTTGELETFIADDKVRGERVLVHILHCDPQKPNQPTVVWVLEAFRRIAPEPVGLVLETGRYGETLYAYLVTKLPEPAALRGWVQRYEDQGRETQDLPAILKPTPESEAPTADLPGKEPVRIPGPISQLFQEFDQQAKPVTLGDPAKEEQRPAPAQPLVPSMDHSGVRKASPGDLEVRAIPVPPRAEPTISSPTNSFRSDFKTKDFAPESFTPETKIGPRPGEFTSFFQGPFRGDSPSEIPAMSSQPVEPPRKTVGDFTAVFGAVKAQAEEPLPTSGIAGNEPAGSGFTGWFKADVPSRTSSTTLPPASTGLPLAAVDSTTALPPSMEPFIPEPSVSRVEPPILSTPAIPNPVLQTRAGTESAALHSDAATRSFSRPVIEPVPSQPTVPSEPSAYTQIISVKPRIASAKAEGGQQEAASKPTTPPPSPALTMPPVPAFTPPPLPPPFSKPPAPAMPKLAVPPPPAAPQLAKVELPPSAVSYWPLILTLTILFFIAVLLVLYFVLKH